MSYWVTKSYRFYTSIPKDNLRTATKKKRTIVNSKENQYFFFIYSLLCNA